MKITYDEIHLLIYKISNNLNEINYKPDLIVAIRS
jgi:hypoxanthine phosphoribosyltransferase